MNNEFTSCNDCKHYPTYEEHNYPCDQCLHNYSEMFKMDTAKRIERLESLVTQRGARMQVMMKQIKMHCPSHKQSDFEEWFDERGLPL